MSCLVHNFFVKKDVLQPSQFYFAASKFLENEIRRKECSQDDINLIFIPPLSCLAFSLNLHIIMAACEECAGLTHAVAC